MAASSKSLKDYLKRYESNNEEEKKKKMKKKVKPEAPAVLIMDGDPVWQKPVEVMEEEENDSGEEDGKPVVDEDIEVKRMRRLEQIRARRPYNAIADDGSGWVSFSPKGTDGFDMSPPRKRRVRNDTPSPKAEAEADMDLSPPRQRRMRHRTPSPESDPKPGVNSDLSPPRKRRTMNDLPSPDRNKNKNRRQSGSLDLSPPRKNQNNSSGPAALMERPKTGLITGREIREEISKVKKEDMLRFEQMDPSMSGRSAEPVYRDQKGERISKDEYMKLKQKQEEKPKEKKIEWGKGLAQKREAEARLQDLELEKDKPFARTRDDPELDKMLKDRIRWGDPMAHLVKKKHPQLVLADLGDNEKMKESGFIIPQDIPSHSWIKRGLDAAPNRYGIKPGRHWDGVDRSNGFEKELFKRMNEKQATEREAYLWSVSDM